MKVRKIDTDNRKDVNRFIKFSYDLYRDDPLWVPPILSEMRNNMNKRKYPFFKHSEAEFLVVESDGQVLGRVAIMNNKNFK